MALHQSPFLSLMLGFLGFALWGYATPEPMEMGHFDVNWDFCRYLQHCIDYEPDFLKPEGWPELDIHEDGYTLRSEPAGEIDVARRNGTLDTEGLGAALSSLHISFSNYSRLKLYVESGVPYDDVLHTADYLRTLGGETYLRLEEPPSRGFCVEPSGCVPLNPDVVIARLLDKGGHLPACSEDTFTVIMHYEVLQVLEGQGWNIHEDLYAAHRCPDLGWGSSGGSFQVSDKYRLTLPATRLKEIWPGMLIDAFTNQIAIPRLASRIEREPTAPLRAGTKP